MSEPTQREITAGFARLRALIDERAGIFRSQFTDELLRYAASEVLWAAHEARKGEK